MKFDLVVVTAANAAQARGYRAQLAGREGFLVVPDPGGRRVGSLGATVNALRRIARRGRVLVCHSGGDARRTPGYAAMGKCFVPMRDGRPLLDHIIGEMERLPGVEGLFVCCGDVVPRLGGKVRFAKRGVTGVAYPDGPWQARRHGVYVERGGRVVDFLQKPRVTRGRHLIDTGILRIDWATAEKMVRLPVAGDIYEEFPKLLLEGLAPFHVSVVPSCEFFHIGSTRELLKLLGDGRTLVDSVRCPLSLAGGNVVTNVPAGRFERLVLGRGECFTCLPVGKSGWYDLKYRLDDNFKTDGLWERHGLGELMKRVDHRRLLAVRAAPGVVRADGCVRVTAPVRIDFAGGWSDTPPICNDEGGTVFNAAVQLEGRRPVAVEVRPRKDGFVRIVSKDLGKRRLIRSAAELADHADPHDWCALVKSALAVTGFAFGSRGLDITIDANLPKGSGMGTSSILGAATIAALLGKADVDRVSELTLRLEREMRTGGGWQDQLGGLVGGFKLLRSRPGRRQHVEISAVTPPPAFRRALERRALLYFTGQKRMARNILRKVLAFYAENPHDFAKVIVRSLKRDAEACAAAVRRGDVDAFARAVNGYWRDKKLLDPGSTNERVEEIVERIRPWTSAVTLTGAGGGGFMFILARSARAADLIRAELGRNPPSSSSRFYDFTFDPGGLAFSD